MRCPYCDSLDDRVVESRTIGDGRSIRRRRECLGCKGRFTSYEKIEERSLMVVKKNGVTALFDREKVRKGILKAIEKRPVHIDQVEEIVDAIEAELNQSPKREVDSIEIGELVMKALKNLDQVAYVRFASVYRQFQDVKEFISEIKKM
jgi:transcriptional repressor NrdR